MKKYDEWYGPSGFEKFKELKALVEIELEHKIKMYRSDNGGKLV